MNQFLKLPADELLNEFGAGHHIPGSGSAAALIGLVAANLASTVGQLTLNKPAYEEFHKEVEAICQHLQTDLIPKLTSLFQQDAEAFDAVYNARIARRGAIDEQVKRRLKADWLSKQRVATAIPIKIANACVQIIDHATRLFDVGFKSARGDTGVALGAAVAGVLSAVYVINLNLVPYEGNYWAQQRRKECDQLQQTALDKYEAALLRLNLLRAEDVDTIDDADDAKAITTLLSCSKQSYTDEEIEERARQLRRIIWKNRDRLSVEREITFKDSDLMDPEIALHMLGYSYSLAETLGKHDALEVAGELDSLVGAVSVSRQMKPEIRLFTCAHELGHILLHPELTEAHRDLPSDGSEISRLPKEREADRFAASFLMPSIPVNEKFSAIFGKGPFILSDATSFALTRKSESETKREIKSMRELSVKLATTERYDGRQVVSLATQFKVSAKAMAIRLEELKLVRFEH